MNIEQAMTPNPFDSVHYLTKLENVVTDDPYYAVVLSVKDSHSIRVYRNIGKTNYLSIGLTIDNAVLEHSKESEGWLATLLADRFELR